MHAHCLVLGSGPGGYTAAFRAADLGLDTVLVERHTTLGGVCLNVGCIPSKALLHVAEVMAEVEALAAHGVVYGDPSVDLDSLRAFKDGVVGKLTDGLTTMAEQRSVTVVQGTGTFSGPNSMRVEGLEGVQEITFDSAVIAAGSRVAKLSMFPWEDRRVWDSTDALELVDVPGRLLVVGGGIIGLELATVFDALGSRVTVVELLKDLMTGADRDLVRVLQRRIGKRYENVFTSTKVTGITPREDGLHVTMEGRKAPAEDVFDAALIAVGRRPNGDRIGAEAAGVTVTERGFVPVDKQQRTNVPHIFAIGDIVGEPMLAHKATHEGKIAAEVAAGHKSGFDAEVIPSVAYTDPEIAWVGLTETQAKADGRAVGVGVFPWAASGRALSMGGEGRTKLIFDPDTDRVLGGGIVGPRAGELIAEVALAIEMGAEAADIGLTIHPHPTLSESVMLAAEVYEGTVTDLYAPKKKRR
jgi:dihydrolipoamide dehydrogenase